VLLAITLLVIMLLVYLTEIKATVSVVCVVLCTAYVQKCW